MSWTWQQAQDALSAAQAAHDDAVEQIGVAGRAMAAAQREALVAVHHKRLALRAQGVAQTVAESWAKKDPEVAAKSEAAVNAEAVFTAARAAAFARGQDRADARALTEWAMRQAVADGSVGSGPQLAWSKGEAA